MDIARLLLVDPPANAYVDFAEPGQLPSAEPASIPSCRDLPIVGDIAEARAVLAEFYDLGTVLLELPKGRRHWAPATSENVSIPLWRLAATCEATLWPISSGEDIGPAATEIWISPVVNAAERAPMVVVTGLSDAL